jgi:proteasome lid subunit RPN8/RPN11
MRDDWARIMSYVLATDDEIAGYAYGVIDREGVLIDGLTPLPMQERKGAEVTIQAGELAKLISGDERDIVLHWHSHNRMSANFSATDRQHQTEVEGVMAYLVVNHKGEWSACLRQISPIEATIPLELEICDDVPDDDEIKKEIEACTVKPPPALPERQTDLEEYIAGKGYKKRDSLLAAWDGYGYWHDDDPRWLEPVKSKAHKRGNK